MTRGRLDNRYWLYILSAGLEVVWVSGLKYANTVVEWAATILAIVASFAVLILSSKHLPVGTVYAVFTGLGTVGTVLAEIILFGEPINVYKILLIATLLIGVIGLKLLTSDSSEPSNNEHVTVDRGAL